jgi:hypothetical protein
MDRPALIPTATLDHRRDDLVMPRPNELSRTIHRHGRFFAAELDHYSAIVEAYGNALLATLISYTPASLQTIVKRLFKSIGCEKTS